MDFIPLILAPPWGLGFGTGTESGISRRNNRIGMRGEERRGVVGVISLLEWVQEIKMGSKLFNGT
jgi:hypothetical protein